MGWTRDVSRALGLSVSLVVGSILTGCTGKIDVPRAGAKVGTGASSAGGTGATTTTGSGGSGFDGGRTIGQDGGVAPPPTSGVIFGPTSGRRLTREEYLNTVGDVLGAQAAAQASSAATALDGPPPVLAMLNDISARTIQDQFVTEYSDAATAVATNVPWSQLATYASCTTDRDTAAKTISSPSSAACCTGAR